MNAYLRCCLFLVDILTLIAFVVDLGLSCFIKCVPNIFIEALLQDYFHKFTSIRVSVNISGGNHSRQAFKCLTMATLLKLPWFQGIHFRCAHDHKYIHIYMYVYSLLQFYCYSLSKHCHDRH